MAEFACKMSYAFKGYLGDLLFFSLKQSYYKSILESFRVLFQTGLIVKRTINELDPSDTFQFVSELQPMSYLSEIKYRSLS